MNGLAETNSTPIFLFFESVLKLIKSIQRSNLEISGRQAQEPKGGIPREFPQFPKIWEFPGYIVLPGNGEYSTKIQTMVHSVLLLSFCCCTHNLYNNRKGGGIVGKNCIS